MSNNDHQQKPDLDFGRIAIRPGKKNSARSPREKAPAPPLHLRDDDARQRTTTKGPVTKTGPSPPKKHNLLRLLLLPTLLILCWLAGGAILVPMFIQGPLADRFAQRLQRPVTVERATFSPISLQLHLAGIRIGADPEQKNDPEMGTVAVVDARMRLSALFRGRVVLENTDIDRLEGNLVRYRDGRYNFSPQGVTGESGAAGLAELFPPWLSARGVSLNNSKIIFSDRPTGRKHVIADIQLSLPDPAGVSGDSPFFSATVNNSPVLLRGGPGKERAPDKGSVLSLQLADIDPQQYLAYLPGTAQRFAISGGRADITLEITLPGRGQPLKNLLVRGSINSSGLLLKGGTKRAQLQAALPVAAMTLEALPLQHMLVIKELSLAGPQLTVSGDPAEASTLLMQLAALVQTSTTGISIDRFICDQGTVTAGTTWRDLHLELSHFVNHAAHRRMPDAAATASVLLTAQGPAALAFHGQLQPSVELSGTLSLRNIKPNLLQRLLVPARGLHFKEGAAELDGKLVLRSHSSGKPSWNLTADTLKISNFSIQEQKKLRLKGKEITGRDCIISRDGAPPRCQHLTINKALFTESAVAAGGGYLLNNKTGQPPFPADEISLKSCSARISLAPGQRGSRLLEFRNLSGVLAKNRLELQATVAPQGRLKMTGSLAPTDKRSLSLSAQGIELRLLSPSKGIRGGQLALEGKLRLPDLSFSGILALNNLTAVNEAGSSLQWKNGAASDAAITFSPLTIRAQSMLLEQPLAILRPDTADPAAELVNFFAPQNSTPLLPIQAAECLIESGRLQQAAAGDEHLAQFTQIQGTVSPLQPDEPASFKLSGRMDKADFQLSGRVAGDKTAFELTTEHFPLARLAANSLKQLDCRTDAAVASWKLSNSAAATGSVTVTGLRPKRSSAYSLVLALLTDTNNSFTLPLPGPQSPHPAAEVGKAVATALNRLHLQAVISSTLVLQHFLPDLNLPPEVEFFPGETTPDFMAELDDYKLLLERRPYLGLAVRAHFDDSTDRRYLMNILQEAARADIELENIRREQERSRLIAAEELKLAALTAQGKTVDRSHIEEVQQRKELQPLVAPKVTLPDQALQNLAKQRAGVIVDYLEQTLQIPADKISLLQPSAGGAKVEIDLIPRWKE